MARKGPLPPLLLINPASTVTVRRDGQWQTIGPLKALVADVGDLNIVHRTVFSRPKESVNAPQVSPCAHQTEGQTNPTVCDRRVLREEGTQRRVGRQRRYTDHIVSSRRMGTDASSNVGGVISAKRGTCSQRLSSTGHRVSEHAPKCLPSTRVLDPFAMEFFQGAVGEHRVVVESFSEIGEKFACRQSNDGFGTLSMKQSASAISSNNPDFFGGGDDECRRVSVEVEVMRHGKYPFHGRRSAPFRAR